MAHKMITCKSCNAVLDVGDEERAMVVHCFRSNQSCVDVKMWGSAKTRVECEADDDAKGPTHILQTNPPETEEELLAKVELAAIPPEPYPVQTPNYGSDP